MARNEEEMILRKIWTAGREHESWVFTAPTHVSLLPGLKTRTAHQGRDHMKVTVIPIVTGKVPAHSR